MEKRYLTLDEACEFTGYPKHSIYSWVSQRRIPHIRKHRRLRFDRHELEKWMNEDARPVVEDETMGKGKRGDV